MRISCILSGRAPVVFGLLTLLATSLQATSTFTLTGVDSARGANVTFYNVVKGANEQGFAGAILGSFDGVNISPLFCVDLYTDINYGAYTSVAITPRPARQEDRVAWLYLNQLSTVNSADTGLAFQLAIWDIVHDNGDGLAAGLVQNSSTSFIGLTQIQMDLATGYINSSVGHSATLGLNVYLNTDPTTGAPAQTLIGLAAPVPEPATGSLAVLGIAYLVMHARKKRGERGSGGTVTNCDLGL